MSAMLTGNLPMLRRAFLALVCLWPLAGLAQTRFITVASTTSTEQSGLFAHIIPLFRQQTGIDVRVVAVGTGQALQMGMRGDVDALLVHDRMGEDKFVAEGHGLDRRDVMFNNFVVAGRPVGAGRSALGRPIGTSAVPLTWNRLYSTACRIYGEPDPLCRKSL
jgi:ABC-type tungstate transport system permease subunit